MDFQAWLKHTTEWLMTSGLRIVLIFILMLIALRLAHILSRRIFAPFKKDGLEAEIKKRTDTLSSLIRYILGVSIILVTLVMILGEFGIEIGPILAAAGIVGLAIGFGSQQLVQDVISGFFILMEDQIRVGDVINIAGKSGLVERITLRTTTLRDISGSVHFVRNGYIDIVTNMTKEYSYYVFDIGIAYRENVDEVIGVIRETAEKLRQTPEFGEDILEPIEIMGLDKFADSSVIIKARIKTKPIKQWRIGREFNKRLKTVFDEKNIEIPFPHMTVYMGQDKEGKAAPLNISMPDRK